jgi:hypothetical protein
MSIDGINGIGAGYGALNPANLRPRAPEGPRPEQVGDPRIQQPGAQPLGVNQAPAARRPQGSLPADAPAGTDPQLWSVLTADERTFFARARAMGPLTYGPGQGGGAAGPASGGRIDIRV